MMMQQQYRHASSPSPNATATATTAYHNHHYETPTSPTTHSNTATAYMSAGGKQQQQQQQAELRKSIFPKSFSIDKVYEFPARSAQMAIDEILNDCNDAQQTVSVRIDNSELPKRAHIARIEDLFEQTLAYIGTGNVSTTTPVFVTVHRADPQQPMQLFANHGTFQFNAQTAKREIAKIVLSYEERLVQAVMIFDAHRVFPGTIPMNSLRAGYEFSRKTLATGEYVSVITIQVVPNDSPLAAVNSGGVNGIRYSSLPTDGGNNRVSLPTPPVAMMVAANESETPTPVQKKPISSVSSNGGQSSSEQQQQQQQSSSTTPAAAHNLAPASKMYAPHMQQDAAQRNQQQYETREQTAVRRKDQPPSPFHQPDIGPTTMYFEMGAYGNAPRASGGAPTLPMDFFSS